ncbi:unnamed protein product [Gongylonema pulchrum]|uniref:TFR_dimer domain-containing protein n=1 Tax=Gongylonema pulchrum TaxID=637853 RepID=A0A183EB09_9BILA|nr:unnamed protein product [Gongylonema pulchrum]
MLWSLKVHEAVGRYWAALACEFTDSTVLPMNITDLALSLTRLYVPQIKKALEQLREYWDILEHARTQLSHFIKASSDFLDRARRFEGIIQLTLHEYVLNPYELNIISLLNDRLMEVERCFVNPRGMPEQPSQRHMLFSVNSSDEYSSKVMGSVHNAVRFLEFQIELKV